MAIVAVRSKRERALAYPLCRHPLRLVIRFPWLSSPAHDRESGGKATAFFYARSRSSISV